MHSLGLWSKSDILFGMQNNYWLEETTQEKIRSQVASVLDDGVNESFKKRAQDMALDPENAFENISQYSPSQWTSAFVEFWTHLSQEKLEEIETKQKTQQYMTEAGLFGVLDLPA